MKAFFTYQKAIKLLEHFLFLVLAVFAIALYQERLLADSSYYLFQVINKENFHVEHHRYILIFSQWLPLMAIKLGLKLNSILLLYSLGHVLFFYVIYLITRYLYRMEYVGFLLLLVQTLGTMSGFFVPMFEMYYAAGLLVLFAAVLYYSKSKHKWLILFSLAFFIFSGHPLAALLLFLVLGFHALDNSFKSYRLYIGLIMFFALIFLLKQHFITDYDRGKTEAFLYNLKHASYNFDYIKGLAGFLWRYYKFLLGFALLTWLYLSYKGKWLHVALSFTAFVFVLALVNISAYGFEQSRYQEQVYFPLVFIVSFPFWHYLLKSEMKGLNLFFSVLVVIAVSVQVYGIHMDSQQFIQRNQEIHLLVNKAREMESKKCIVSKDSLKQNANWSYPIESLLFSSIAGSEHSITICTDEDYYFNENNKKLQADMFLFRRWELYPDTWLNGKFFQMDGSIYKPLNP